LFLEAFLRSGINNQGYQSSFRAFAGGLHGQPSIDQYLNFHVENKQFETIGKIAIAQIIMEHERASIFRQDMTQDGVRSISGTWILNLIHLMLSGVAKDSIESAFNNVSFICFNYDRCIEAAFYLILIHTVGLSAADAAKALQHLKIWHPYGSVGQAIDSPMGGFRRGYIDANELLQASRGIRTFAEGMHDESERAAIVGEIESAKQLVFLGFSYGTDNMSLLTINDTSLADVVLANTYGLSASNASSARESCCSTLNWPITHFKDRVFRTPANANDVIAMYGPALCNGMLSWQIKQGHILEGERI